MLRRNSALARGRRAEEVIELNEDCSISRRHPAPQYASQTSILCRPTTTINGGLGRRRHGINVPPVIGLLFTEAVEFMKTDKPAQVGINCLQYAWAIRRRKVMDGPFIRMCRAEVRRSPIIASISIVVLGSLQKSASGGGSTPFLPGCELE